MQQWAQNEHDNNVRTAERALIEMKKERDRALVTKWKKKQKLLAEQKQKEAVVPWTPVQPPPLSQSARQVTNLVTIRPSTQLSASRSRMNQFRRSARARCPHPETESSRARLAQSPPPSRVHERSAQLPRFEPPPSRARQRLRESRIASRALASLSRRRTFGRAVPASRRDHRHELTASNKNTRKSVWTVSVTSTLESRTVWTWTRTRKWWQ